MRRKINPPNLREVIETTLRNRQVVTGIAFSDHDVADILEVADAALQPHIVDQIQAAIERFEQRALGVGLQ